MECIVCVQCMHTLNNVLIKIEVWQPRSGSTNTHPIQCVCCCLSIGKPKNISTNKHIFIERMHFVCIFENANTMNKNPLNNETTMKLAAERKWKRIRHKRGAFGLVGIVMVVTLKPISWKNNAMDYIYIEAIPADNSNSNTRTATK